MDVQKINDMRQRILKSKALRDAGEELPEGLYPSEEELREVLIAARGNRSVVADQAKARKEKKSSGIDATTDLNSLFKS